jgi:hypothetical protein
MRLAVMLSFSVAFLLFSDLGMCAVAPKSGDTLEYLKLLADIKNGNYTFKGNKTADKPWIYTSQGLEFEAKLKERKLCINVYHQVPTKY